MKRILGFLLLCFFALLPVQVCSESIVPPATERPYDSKYVHPRGVTQAIPWYFIAIHNEPFNHERKRFFINESYKVLQQMVAKADSFNIKLTLMFAASWVDFIKEKKEEKRCFGGRQTDTK